MYSHILSKCSMGLVSRSRINASNSKWIVPLVDTDKAHGFFFLFYMQIDDSLVGKELPAMQETLLQFQVREDPREKEKAIHSSLLVWSTP